MRRGNSAEGQRRARAGLVDDAGAAGRADPETPMSHRPAPLLVSMLCAALLASAARADMPPPKGVIGKTPTISPEMLAAHPGLKPEDLDLQYWTPPYRIYAQQLSDQIMAGHPELLAANLHGPVPGMDYKTLIAGPFAFRIGTVEDEGDMMVLDHGIYLVAPHYQVKQQIPDYEVLLPIQDAAGRRKGMLVLIYKKAAFTGPTAEADIFASAIRIRDDLARRVPAYEDLFKPAN